MWASDRSHDGLVTGAESRRRAQASECDCDEHADARTRCHGAHARMRRETLRRPERHVFAEGSLVMHDIGHRNSCAGGLGRAIEWDR
jgi:hypothetical protein